MLSIIDLLPGFRWMIAIFGAVLSGIGIYMINKAKNEENTLYRIQRLPPIELEDATDGVPLKAYGRIICKETYFAPYSKKNCVWSHSVKQIYEETTDSKGRKSGHWRTVEDIRKSVAFLLDDSTGKVGVNLQDASDEFIDGKKVFDWNGFEGFHETKREEWVIEPANAFVYGMAVKEGNTCVIMKSKQEPIAVSNRIEADFLAFKRSDDKMVNAFSYGMAVIGGILIAVAVLG